LIILSSVATMLQEGFVFHAALETFSVGAFLAQGPWVAKMTLRSAAGTSWAKN
jgi:hypothetical protein